MALPELDGGLEPIVFAGRDSGTGKSHSLPDRIDSLCSRAINWAKCARGPLHALAAHSLCIVYTGASSLAVICPQDRC